MVAFLTGWGNAPFAVALGAVVAFALLQSTGILGLLAGGEGHDHDVDHDVTHDTDDPSADDHGQGAALARGSSAAALGFGTLPFTMIWEVFALAAGVTGYALNLGYFGAPSGPPVHTLAWTVPGASLAGSLAVATLARWLGPVFAFKDQEATSRVELVGQIGVVISSKVDEEFGEVRIRDKTGHDLRVVCRLAKGSTGEPREQDHVVVVECDAEGALLVEALDVEARRGV
ncbi:MAG: hypothetical protein ABSC94_11700 [Polyangiaceae bacterium]|jgi:hypothetical protein